MTEQIPAALGRPKVIDDISSAYADRGKSVVLLTGNTHDLFYSQKAQRFVDLGFTLYHHLSETFIVLRQDIATGLDGYHVDDVTALQEVINKADATALVEGEGGKVGDILKKMAATRHSPLPSLVLLHEILQAVKKVRQDIKKPAKPVCVVLRFAGSLFPAGEFDKLPEIDRQRLVTFLNLIESQWFKDSGNLLVLLADTRSEVNSRILAQPCVHSIEIDLPDKALRKSFVERYLSGKNAKVSFSPSQDDFVEDTAGLTLTALNDLLESARRTNVTLGRKEVLEEVNRVMKADLGDIIKIIMPEHGPADIVGYAKTGEIIRSIFERCERVEEAIAAFLVSGANGSGKTYQLEAYAAASGRVVIALTGLRGMYYGQTDGFFEKLRLRLKTYGKILILVDEAHTQFGSVHKTDTHETEKRLAGNIIMMMSDPTLLGKVLWALGSSRPDELDPDVKSRSPVQIPIFDLQGEERKSYVLELFKRKGVPVPENEVEEVLKITATYSNRDYTSLVKEVKGWKQTSVLATLQIWRASASILRQRYMQTLIAAQHCSYPGLMPEELAEKADSGALEEEIEILKAKLLR